jgi:hypothetical protein
MFSGKKRIFLLFSVILLTHFSAGGQTLKGHRYSFKSDHKEDFFVISDHSIIINYSISELNIESLNNEHGSWYRIAVPGHTPVATTGKPELPVLSRIITIPLDGRYTIKITDVSSSTVKPSGKGIRGLLFPVQEGMTKAEQQRRPDFTIDRNLYASRSLIGADTVTIEMLGKLRGRQLANVVVSPVRYDPRTNQLEIITSMKIEVSFPQAPVSAVKSISSESALFGESLAKGVINYKPDEVITGYSDQPVKMIILTDTVFKKHLDPLLKWKTQKGFRLNVLYRGPGLAGVTYIELKDTLRKIYNSYKDIEPYPEFLLIIGDVTKIPLSSSTDVTDLYYGEFDGNGDYIPDMYIGRLPVTDTTQLKAVIRKIIQYEKFEFADTNKFYTRALATAGKDEVYSSYMNGQINYAVTNYLNVENKIENYHFYYPESYTKKDSIMGLIKNGISFLNYSGHGDKTGWLHLDIKGVDIRRFGNKNMYPFVISNACRTASFNDTTSFGSRMVVASDKGAIGFIGCSNDSYWDEDFYWAVGTGNPNAEPKYSETGLGAYDRLFHTNGELPSDWYITMGQVNYAGNLAVSASSSSRKKYYWETYTLLGDPSLIPYTGQPDHFEINLPDVLPNGMTTFSFTVTPFAYVAISHRDTLLDASFAGPSGSVVLDLPGISNDSCLIVITGQGKIPLLKTIYFSEINQEFLNLNGYSVNDLSGNNNGIADFGESIFLKLRIANLGLTDADNLIATLSSSSEWVTLTNTTVSIESLPAMSELILEPGFGMTIANEIPDQGIISFSLILKSSMSEKHYKIDITVHAPRLEIITCIIDDSESGNNNFIADPGETFTLVFRVSNNGSSSTSGSFNISSLTGNLIVLEPSIKSGVLHFGEATDISVKVRLSEQSMPGDYFSISSILDCSPYLVSKDYSFRVGRIRESFESATFDVFPWINISQKPWVITGINQIDGIVSARSGYITHNSTSSLIIRAFYSGSDTLKFHYKVSSEFNYDFLSFRLNGTELLRKSGEVPWELKSVPVPAGLATMEWIYKKDNSVSQGADCAYLDLIDFSVSSPVRYIQKDLEVARIVSPGLKDKYGNEAVTVKVLNKGRETIEGFSLAFSVNGATKANQVFSNILPPLSDSLTVTFTTKADLSKYGIYDMTVFAYGNYDDYLYNDTLSVRIENTQITESVTVYPNPVREEVRIKVNSNVAAEARITLTSVSGVRVYDNRTQLVAGENIITIDSRHLSPAVYVLNLRGGNLDETISLIKIR